MPIFRKFPLKNAAKPLIKPAARRMMFSFRRPLKRDLPAPFNSPYVLLAVLFFGSLLFLIVLSMMFAPRAMTGAFVSVANVKGAKATSLAIGQDGHLMRSLDSKQEFSVLVKKNVGTISLYENKKQCITRGNWPDVNVQPCGRNGQKWLVDHRKHMVQAIDDKSGKALDQCFSSAFGSLNHGARIVLHECGGKGVHAVVPEDQVFNFRSSYYLKV